MPFKTSSTLIAFIPTTNPEKSLHFYTQMLELELISQDPFAIVLNSNGIMIRITTIPESTNFKPHPFTILGWNVPSAHQTTRDLAAKGIIFERYPNLPQDPDGIWLSPSAAKIAWFKDPDGNVLSITELPS
jgi:catechol 2,3-dioxygenase-like lactoylglutathione lyase family enzyme